MQRIGQKGEGARGPGLEEEEHRIRGRRKLIETSPEEATNAAKDDGSASAEVLHSAMAGQGLGWAVNITSAVHLRLRQ